MAIASKQYECLSSMIPLHRVVKKHVCANGMHDYDQLYWLLKDNCTKGTTFEKLLPVMCHAADCSHLLFSHPNTADEAWYILTETYSGHAVGDFTYHPCLPFVFREMWMYNCTWMGTVHKSAGKLLYVHIKEVLCDQFHSRAKLSTKSTK